jgi:hypothetical protein
MTDARTNELIAKALAHGLGQGEVEITAIECLDSHLHGHAFKYHQGSSNIAGVYPYRIAYRDRNGRDHSVDVMVKAKPDEADILAVYQGLLDHCGIMLPTPLAACLKNSDYSTPNLKEAVLFRDFWSDLDPYLPESLGVYIDEATSYTLRLERILPAGSVILDPDDDTTAQWEPSFSALTLNAMADIHARFYGRYRALCDTGFFPVCNSAVMVQGRALWQAFCDFLSRAYPEVMTENLARRHRAILDSLSDWYALVDQQPKTLLYGDVNPQNLAFAKTPDGFRLSVFDWERAVISLPQRDLAEHLIYTLPDDFSKREALDQIDFHLTSFARHYQGIAPQPSLDGLIWMLYDLIINRLPLMMIVNHVAHKRRHAGKAYIHAHRLLSYLT